MPTIGLLTLSLHINHAQSLKDKRQILRSLKDRLRRQLNVSIAEIDFQETWQRSAVAIVTVSNHKGQAQQVLERAESEASRLLGENLTSSETEYF